MSTVSRTARGLFIAFLGVLLAGFGACGAYGTFGAVAVFVNPWSGEGRAFAPILLFCGVVGLGIAWLCWKAIAALRSTPVDRE